MEYVKTGVTEGVPDVDVDGVKTGVIETYGVFQGVHLFPDVGLEGPVTGR